MVVTMGVVERFWLTTFDHFVENGRLTHTVDSAENVDLPVEILNDVPRARSRAHRSLSA